MSEARKGHGILMFIKFKSKLESDELIRRYQERLPEFQALPGLVQKYYVHDQKTGEWGGVYIWDSKQSMEAYLASDLRKSIAEVYEVAAPPRVDVCGVVDLLRP